MDGGPRSLRVDRIREDGEEIRVLELAAPDGGELPPFRAGAHIDLALGGGLIRQYSLINGQQDRHRYVIAVARAPASRGGSAWLHENVKEGDLLPVSAPRSHFGLDETARHSVLIAGGIGITPLWSMAQQLSALGRSWVLHYGARERRAAALIEDIEALAGDRAHTYFSCADGGRRLDVGDLVWDAPPGSHFYCCGPSGMIESFRQACAGLAAQFVHFERFTAAAPAAADGGFTVVLARSKREIEVQPGETILEALKSAGLNAAYSCREGVCGSCETTVVSGVPDHRDAVLSDAERGSNQTMMICCSGSLSDRLVLDL
ncbi:MAG: oxidoreductase [Phenylobacterium sp.]|nr:oxidoreductase [Phenylobacterium sp.]